MGKGASTDMLRDLVGKQVQNARNFGPEMGQRFAFEDEWIWCIWEARVRGDQSFGFKGVFGKHVQGVLSKCV